MVTVHCFRSVPIIRTPRVKQLEGMFDVPPLDRSERRWEATLPLEEHDWRIGLIVGPSGCGKSTLARELFPEALIQGFDWPDDKSIVDAFPLALGIRDIVNLLSSVGFSSPPSWLRPFRALSSGEQFRVLIARALAEKPGLAVIDEFTSVVDRTVARIGSAAIAKTIRRSNRRLVAVSCHYDVIDWLCPDWLYDPAADEFQWRSLPRRGATNAAGAFPRRPPIQLQIARVHRSAWRLFRQHHYLSAALHRSAMCFVAFVAEDVSSQLPVARGDSRTTTDNWPLTTDSAALTDGPVSTRQTPAAFTAVLHSPDARGGYWREHRTVCLPDFQGVGIGHALSEYVASLFVATGKRFHSRTSHPAMIHHRASSPLWRMRRGVAFGARHDGQCASMNRGAAVRRLIAGFRFIGDANFDAAENFGIVPHRRSATSDVATT